MRLTAREWLGLLDADSFVEEDAHLAPCDPLEFVSAKDVYAQKLTDNQERTGLNDALISGRGSLAGHALRIAVSEFAFIGGSMGSVYGERLARAAEHAAEARVPLLTITATGGARQHEGVLSLMQMAKISAALAALDEARLPFISILTDPTTGGVTASFAMLGDVILAEPKALIGFAGPRVIEQTIRQKLPKDFQRSEFLLDHGMIDAIVDRRELRNYVIRLLNFMMNPEIHGESDIERARRRAASRG
jgi:acetyl-CoA carboxylase carboxyl transferase subunit beta